MVADKLARCLYKKGIKDCVGHAQPFTVPSGTEVRIIMPSKSATGYKDGFIEAAWISRISKHAISNGIEVTRVHKYPRNTSVNASETLLPSCKL